MPMQLKQTVHVFIVNVFIGMNPTTFYIPLLNVNRLSPSLIKLFSSWFNKTNFLECCIMEMTNNYLNSTIAYSSPNTSYIVKK